MSWLVTVLKFLFQSTLPRGSDGQGDKVIILHKYFNPRSLAGATTLQASVGISYAISIHAPSRERPLG